MRTSIKIQHQLWQLKRTLHDIYQLKGTIRTDPGLRSYYKAQIAVATAMANAGRPEEVRVLIRDTQDHAAYRASSLSTLAIALFQAERFEEANEVFEQIRSIAQEESVLYFRTYDLMALVTALLHTHRFWEVKEVVNEIVRIAHEMPSIEARSVILADLITTLTLQVQILGDAHLLNEELYEFILTIVQDSSHLDLTDNTLTSIATALAQLRRWDEARRTADRILSHPLKTKTWAAIATALAKAGHFEDCRELINTKNIRYRYQITSVLVSALVQAQRFEEANELIEQIRMRAQEEFVPSLRADDLIALLTALLQVQRLEEIDELIEEIVTNVQGVPSREGRSVILIDLATCLAQAQQWAKGRRIAQAIPDSDLRANVLAAIVTVGTEDFTRWLAKLAPEERQEVVNVSSQQAIGWALTNPISIVSVPTLIEALMVQAPLTGTYGPEFWQASYQAIGQLLEAPAEERTPQVANELFRVLTEVLSQPLDQEGDWSFLRMIPSWFIQALQTDAAQEPPAWLTTTWPKWSYKDRLSFGLLVATAKIHRFPIALVRELPKAQRLYDHMIDLLDFWWQPSYDAYRQPLTALLQRLPSPTSVRDRAQFIGTAITLMRRLVQIGPVLKALELHLEAGVRVGVINQVPPSELLAQLQRFIPQLDALVRDRLGELLEVELDPGKPFIIEPTSDLWRAIVTYHGMHESRFRRLLGEYVIALQQTGNPEVASQAAWDWLRSDLQSELGHTMTFAFETAPPSRRVILWPKADRVKAAQDAVGNQYQEAFTHLQQLVERLPINDTTQPILNLSSRWVDVRSPSPEIIEELPRLFAQLQVPSELKPLIKTIQQHLQQALAGAGQLQHLSGPQEVIIGASYNPVEIVHLGYPSLGGSCLDLIVGGLQHSAQAYSLHPQCVVLFAWRLNPDGTLGERLGRVAALKTSKDIMPLSNLYTSTDLEFGEVFSVFLRDWAQAENLALTKPPETKFAWFLLPLGAHAEEVTFEIPALRVARFYSDLTGEVVLPTKRTFTAQRWVPPEQPPHSSDTPSPPTSAEEKIAQDM